MAKELKFVPMYEIGKISPLYPCIENGETFTRLMPQLGFYADKNFLLYYKDDLATAYYEQDDMEQASKFTFEAFSKPAQFDAFVAGANNAISEISKFLKRIDQVDAWSLGRPALLERLLENSELEAGIFAYYNNTQPQNFKEFEARLTAELASKGLTEIEAANAVSILSTSSAPTKLSEEEFAWLHLLQDAKASLPAQWSANDLQTKYPQVYAKVQDHFETFKTLLLGDGNWNPQIEHYITALQTDLARPSADIAQRLKELENFTASTELARTKIIDKLGLSDEAIYYAHVISEVGHLRLSMRIDGFIPLAFSNDVEPLAQTYDLHTPQFNYITYQELQSLATGHPLVSPEALQERYEQKRYLLVVQDGDYKVLFGDEADQAFAELVPLVSRENVDQLQGNTAMEGLLRGTAVVFNWGDDLAEAIKLLPTDAILVAGQTRPQLMPIIRACQGIITDEGGVMSHAAIVARELKLPCVVGTKVATKVLHTGDKIELNATTGQITVIARTKHTAQATPKPAPAPLPEASSEASRTTELARPKLTADQTVLAFDDIKPGQTKLVGGKGASLAELTQAGIKVPPGFVITTTCYLALHDLSIPDAIQQTIIDAFRALGAQRVAVRSSAIAEDSAETSWAGQFDTVLNVTEDKLMDAIKACWASANSELVQDYARDNNIPQSQLAVAVVVQAMVDSEVAGVLFTKNPVTGDGHQVMVEACFGLGELLVQGTVTPDNYVVEKATLRVLSEVHQRQDIMLAYRDGENSEQPVPKPDAKKLTSGQLVQLVELGQKIEHHYGGPQDIEWALAGGVISVVQSRPITT